MRALMETQATFSVVRREEFAFEPSADRFDAVLKPVRLAERRGSRWPGTRLIGRQFARVTRYRCDPEYLPMLYELGSLAAWAAPAMPEDPWFESEQGRVSFLSVSREGRGWLLDSELAEELAEDMTLEPQQIKPHELRELIARG